MPSAEATSTRSIAVIGLGYVGLPVAVAFARQFEKTIGFDIDAARIEQLRRGIDASGSVDAAELRDAKLVVTSKPDDLKASDFFVVAVPTPVDLQHRPDLEPLRAASRTVGRVLKRGAIVVYESTVYPGVTEDVCGPILERESGLRAGVDFKLAYSPERINPGDREHGLKDVVKIVAGQDRDALDEVAGVYESIVDAGLHRASSIKVAEAAKVIENTQRDLNIALMNELAMIFDRLEIDTQEVLEAAGTKWNFLRFSPGLVGGHCIGVDPYYLTTLAEQLGFHPQTILAGRRINDGMGTFIAERTVKQLILAGRSIAGSTVAVLGLAFKENVPDLRNSRVPGLVRELRSYGIDVMVHDPLVDGAEAKREIEAPLVGEAELSRADALILAVPHRGFVELVGEVVGGGGNAAVVIDVKSAVDPASIPDHVRLWRL